MTQFDRVLASLVVIVFLLCMKEFAVEEMKLEQIRLSIELTNKMQSRVHTELFREPRI